MFVNKLSLILSLVLFLIVPSGEVAQAQIQSKPDVSRGNVRTKKKIRRVRPRDRGQVGKVSIEGAAVYEGPSFDAPVMEYLDRGKRVRISNKIYQGIGGLGSFYKIRVRRGVYGYITDVDVTLQKGVKRKRPEPKAQRQEQIPGDPTQPMDMNEPIPSEFGDSFYLTRFWGPAFYSVQYSETVRKQKETSSMTLFGAKISGPPGRFGGMPLDINLLVALSPPAFYDEIATDTSGLMLMGDALTMLPIIDKKTWILYYGFGLQLKYAKWEVTLKDFPNNDPIDSQEVTLGAALQLGAGFRVGRKISLRTDLRYYYEKESYIAFGAAAQFKY